MTREFIIADDDTSDLGCALRKQQLAEVLRRLSRAPDPAHALTEDEAQALAAFGAEFGPER